MTRRVAVWALAGLLASIAPTARGQSAASNVDNADGGIEQTKPRTPGNKDGASDVRALDPARATPSGENTTTTAPAAKQRDDSGKPAPSDVRALDPAGRPPKARTKARTRDPKLQKDARKPAPSDVRALDPTREVPSEENKAAEPGK